MTTAKTKLFGLPNKYSTYFLQQLLSGDIIMKKSSF